MGTHQELEMFGSQPAYPEKLLHKKESLQNQLINIRVELSQASTVMREIRVPFVPSWVGNKQGVPLGTAVPPWGQS